MELGWMTTILDWKLKLRSSVEVVTTGEDEELFDAI